MNQKIFSSLVALSMGTLTVGCTVEYEDEPAPAFTDEGQIPSDELEWGVDYPEGPFGYTVGSIFPNLEMVGYISYISNMQAGIWDESTGRWRQVISMMDLYNPTGTEVFPEGSLYGAGQPKPKALVLVMSALWCSACQWEAQNVLNDKYAEYRDQGGQIMVAMLQDEDQNTSTPADLDVWVSTYFISYLSVVGGSSDIEIFLDGAWPTNIIIDLSTMRVVSRITGSPAEPGSADCAQSPFHPNCTFWTIYESILDGTFVDPFATQ